MGTNEWVLVGLSVVALCLGSFFLGHEIGWRSAYLTIARELLESIDKAFSADYTADEAEGCESEEGNG